MKTSLISDVITLMFFQAGITDDVDLMRCNILAMEMAQNEHNVESIKKTSAYLGCNNNVPMPDEFLQKLFNKKEQILKNA
jgi:hypothetical protein